MKRSPMRRTAWPKKQRKPMERGKPLAWRGRRKETRVGKYTGRVMLGEREYTVLCWQVWKRDGGRCQVNHQPGCWGKLPHFSKRWMDHVKKRSQGGSDGLENMRLCCPYCHDWLDNQGGKISRKQAARMAVAAEAVS